MHLHHFLVRLMDEEVLRHFTASSSPNGLRHTQRPLRQNLVPLRGHLMCLGLLSRRHWPVMRMMTVDEGAIRRWYRLRGRRSRTAAAAAARAVSAPTGPCRGWWTRWIVPASAIVIVVVVVVIIVIIISHQLHHRLRAAAVAAGTGIHPLGPFRQLLALHPPVLEPDLDLSLGQVKATCYLPALLTRYVRVADEFLFEHHGLVTCVRLALLTLSSGRLYRRLLLLLLLQMMWQMRRLLVMAVGQELWRLDSAVKIWTN
jgi:hypothetical protein